MKQTISLNDNYGKRLKDEILKEGVNNGLKGEVQVIVKNKDTGKIEKQERHNLIVYGAREWLLKKCFLSNTCTDNADKKFLQDSEILWFGVGNGGSEPGNPLQCGCTYGSDKDLYNPVRLRYEFDTGSESTNPYYASRIMSNGDIVNGYYKKLTYVGIKEDQANPYQKNGVTYYPNLIAEVRLEISSDDCCGQNWLNNDTEIEYSDINEAALFIADKNLSDPGRSGKLSYVTEDYMYYDPNNKRTYKESGITGIPEHKVQIVDGVKRFVWEDDKTYPDEAIQYFDVYSDNGLVQINTEPFVMGNWTDSQESSAKNKCTGYIYLDDNVLHYHFENTRYGETCVNEGTCTLSTTDYTLDSIRFVSHGTICLDVQKTNRFDSDSTTSNKIIDCYCRYRNGYNVDFTELTPIQNLFVDKKDESGEVIYTVNRYKYLFPIGYVFKNGQLKKDVNFNKLSVIRFIQSIDVYFDINVNQVIVDDKSTDVRFYCDDEYIDKINEGMKFYCTNIPTDCEGYPTEENPSTIIEIFDGRLHRTDSSEEQKVSIPSYFIIDSINIKKSRKFNPQLLCKAFKERTDSPYLMFNRCTFSTIRLSKSREILLVWRIYF